jgi:hypothetical protein
VNRKEDRNGRLGSTAEAGLCQDEQERTLVRGKDQSALQQAWDLWGCTGCFREVVFRAGVQEVTVNAAVLGRGCIFQLWTVGA